jgi:hypothetical protein
MNINIKQIKVVLSASHKQVYKNVLEEENKT